MLFSNSSGDTDARHEERSELSHTHHTEREELFWQPRLFPIILYDMLEDVEQKGLDHIVSWSRIDTPASQQGRQDTFRVHNIEQFEKFVLPRYFKTNRYKPFQRNLNIHKFERVKAREYAHPCLVRGKRGLCKAIKRSFNHRAQEVVKKIPGPNQQFTARTSHCDRLLVDRTSNFTHCRAGTVSLTQMSTIECGARPSEICSSNRHFSFLPPRLLFAAGRQEEDRQKKEQEDEEFHWMKKHSLDLFNYATSVVRQWGG